MPEKHERTTENIAALTKQLERHQTALLEIPGVTGCGVGLTAQGRGRPVIQVFVAQPDEVAGVRSAVTKILGAAEADIVVMPLPAAD